MPWGREKRNIAGISGFQVGPPAIGMRIRYPSAREILLPTGGQIAVLCRLNTALDAVTDPTQTLVSRRTTNSGYRVRVLNTGVIQCMLEGAAGATATATGPRPLTAADINRWMVILFDLTLETAAGLCCYLNGEPGTAVTSVVTYSDNTQDLRFGADDNAGALPATKFTIAQVAMTQGTVRIGDDAALNHFEGSQRALRLEDLPGCSTYVDFADYHGRQGVFTGGSTLVAGSSFGELVRGSRVELLTTANPMGQPIAVMAPADNFLDDWVVV